MTKKEQLEVDALRLDLAMERAMHRSPKVERDVPPPDDYTKLSRGWDFNMLSFNGLGQVYKACSSCIKHGAGWEKTTSQGPINLFSTELMAVQAMRYEMAERDAKQLSGVDKWIEALRNTQ